MLDRISSFLFVCLIVSLAPARVESASALPDIGVGDPKLLLYYFPNIGPIIGGLSVWIYEGSNDAREGYSYGDTNDKDWKNLRLLYRTPQMPDQPIVLSAHHLYPYGRGKAFVRNRTFTFGREAKDRKPVDEAFILLTERGTSIEAQQISEKSVNAEFQLETEERFIGKVGDYVFYRIIGNEHEVFGRAQRTYEWELPKAYLVIGALRGSGAAFRFVYYRSGLGSGRLVETEFSLRDAKR